MHGRWRRRRKDEGEGEEEEVEGGGGRDQASQGDLRKQKKDSTEISLGTLLKTFAFVTVINQLEDIDHVSK